MSSPASATIIVLNYNGIDHLKACLPTLEAQDYPATELMVVDNGSHDGSVAYVRASHPKIRVVDLGANKGFALANNIGARQAATDWVAFLNNDTRLAPTWLSALVAAAERHRAAAAAATIVDWDGSRVDFVGGLPTFNGHSWQIDYGQPVGKPYPERQILFGCGGAVMYRRSIFLEAGGFDESYFIYFEDVDVGWRLTLAGHPTIYAPDAITYHRLHGATRVWASALKLRLYERNALCTIFKNYDDEGLRRVFPAAVALMLARNLGQAGLDGQAIAFGKPAPERLGMPPQLVAALIALEDFSRWLPELREKRRAIQAARRVPDAEVLALMPEPLKLHDVGDRYRDTAEALIRDFRIAELFGLPAPAPRLSISTPGTRLRQGYGGQAPRASVIVLTASGPAHLPECLDALRGQTWPADRTEIIVVDNGSADDPAAAVERHYPGARLIRTGRNLGFSGGNNAGAREATGEYLVFLNDDTRAAPDWLERMIAVAERRQAASVAARIVDWSGERVDFAGGLVNLEGRGYALGYDELADAFPVREEPLLFGCGAAVMFRRDVFDAAGGWDDATFAYYEDVEFGWRLWLLGHEVWFAPDAVVHHKHHGTSGSVSPARARAFERNALRMLYTLLEEPVLQRVLPAALLLSADRTLLGTRFSRGDDAGPAPAASWRTLAWRLQPRVLSIRLLHALSQRGARRERGTIANLKRVGLGGLAGSALDVLRDVRGGWAAPAARNSYLVERTRPSGALEGQVEHVPAATVATLLGVQDFVDALPELSARRARLQAGRRRSDAEIIARFPGRWHSAVPSSRLDLHLALRRTMLDVLDLEGLPAAPPRSAAP